MLRCLLFSSRQRQNLPKKNNPKMRKVCLMTLKCLAEPKRRYLAQNFYFDVKIEPVWLNDEACPNGKRSVFGIVQRRNSLKLRHLKVAYYYYALRGMSHCITSRDFVCHKSPNHSRNRLALWGHSPQSPGKERCVWGKMYALPSV